MLILLSGKKPDKAKAKALVHQFRQRLWEDFSKHGDSRIRAICAIADKLDPLVE